MTVNAPVEDANAQNNRATLISQYNAVIDQIKTTAQDSSFNGVNLLNGDQLKLVFNETGKSTLTIQGVTFDPAGLGLASLVKGTDFLDNASTNKVLDSLEQRVRHAALAGFDLRFEPVDRADPSGLLEEPDQRAADRLVEPDARRYQRGSGEQPGAGHPPVDRGLRAGAGQPVAAERAAAAPLIASVSQTTETAGETPPFFCCSVFERSMSSGLTRGWIPVGVKKTRQNKRLRSGLIPSKPEQLRRLPNSSETICQ